MAVLEIQANGDCVVSKEAIANAGQSLEDPLMRVSLKTPCPNDTESQQRTREHTLPHITL